jgi:hypothetical protein
MSYTLNVNTDEEAKKIVLSIMWRERDIFDHEEALARFQKILEDPNFIGSTMNTKNWPITYRQKIEMDIPVLEGRIAECKALIKSLEDLGKVPPQEKIDQLVAEIQAGSALASNQQ